LPQPNPHPSFCPSLALNLTLAQPLTLLWPHTLASVSPHQAQLQMANAKIIMAQHTKLVDLKDAEIAKLTKRVEVLSSAQERLERLAKVLDSI